MRFIETTREEVERISNSALVPYHDIVSEIEKFLNMNVEAAKIVLDSGEYRSTRSAYYSIEKQIRYHKLPVKIASAGEDLYLIRKEI